MVKRVYSKDETEAILARAIELHGRGDVTSHEDLIAAGREVGLPAEAIESAAAEMTAKRQDEDILRSLRARQWHGFFAHLVPYALDNALLAFINTLTGGPPWVLIVMLGWGVGLASHLLAVANPDRRRLLRRVERERRRADTGVHGSSSHERQRGRAHAGAVRVAAGPEAGAGGIEVDDDDDVEESGAARRAR
jgi:hypothetical protein